jgi:tetratricopeptide (TPR) repeat protein
MDRLPMRKFNVRLFSRLLIGALVVVGVVFLLHYFQSGRVRAALLWQARHAEEQGNLERQADYLSRYLEFAPDDLEERILLGQTLASDKLATTPKARSRAIYVLESALAVDPARHDLRCLLIKVAMDLGRWEQALEHLTILEQAGVQKSEAAQLRGRWNQAKDHFAEADASYATAISLAPHELETYLSRAYLLRLRLKNAVLADKVIDDMVAANPQAFKAYLNRWNYRADFGLLEKKENVAAAGTDVDKARNLAPEEADVRLAVAERTWRSGDLPKAVTELEKGATAHPDDPRFFLAQSALAVRDTSAKQAERSARAERALRKGLETVPLASQTAMLWNLMNLLIDRGDPTEKAEGELNSLLKKFGKSGGTIGSTDYLQARMHILHGRWADAAQLLERVRPRLTSPVELANHINLFLAQCYEQLDDPVQQRQAYERVVDQDPMSHIALKEAGLARLGRERLRLLEAMRGEQPDWKTVDEILARADHTDPEGTEVLLLRVESLAARERLEEARKLLQDRVQRERRNHRPVKVELYTALAALAERQGPVEEAGPILAEARKEHGANNVELRLAEIQYWSLRHTPDAAGELLKVRQQWETFTVDDQALLLRGLAEAYQRMGLAEEALACWRQLAAHPRHRNDARVRLILLDEALRDNDAETADKLAAEIKNVEGNSQTLANYCEGMRLLWRKRRGQSADLNEAYRLLQRVVHERPNWAAGLLALAELESLRGNTKEAAECYKTAFNQAKRNPLVLAQLLGSGGQSPQDVEQTLQRAVIMAENVPEVWVAYIQYLAGRDKARAEAAIKEAEARLPANKRTIALALCYEAVGRGSQAQQLLERAVKEDPDNVDFLRLAAGFYLRSRRFADAERELRKLLSHAKTATADRLWARSGLALVLVASGDYRRLDEAVGLVGLTVDAEGDLIDKPGQELDQSVEGERARARVLSMQLRKKPRTRAIAILESLAARRLLSSDDQFLLAQLYEGQKNWTGAREQFRQVTAVPPENSFYLAYFVQCLLRQHEVEEAQRSLARLEDLEKKQGLTSPPIGTLVLKARILEATGQGDQAIALLRDHANGKDAQPGDVLQVIASFGRQKRYPEALQECERAWGAGKCPPELLSSVNVALLRQAGAANKEFSLLEDRLRQAIRAANDHGPACTALLVQLADLLNQRQRYPEAEKQYRLALDKDPGNLLALNNLAWLMAQRSGNGMEALPLIDRAIALAGPRPELLDTRAIVLLSLRRCDQALADLQRATDEAPEAIHYLHMAQAHKLANKPREAALALAEARKRGLKRQDLHPLEDKLLGKLLEETGTP